MVELMHLFQGKEMNWMALIRIVLLQKLMDSTHQSSVLLTLQ